MKYCRPSSTRSSQFALTIATLFCTVSLTVSSVNCSQVLHAAAQLITGIRRYEHITPALYDTLHWLPISQRITFNTALTMFNCSRGRCPKYFGDVYTPVHTAAARSSRLRPANCGNIVVLRARSARFGCRSFRVCGPTIWNKFPQHLRSADTRERFKCRLKGWLFECAYGRGRL